MTCAECTYQLLDEGVMCLYDNDKEVEQHAAQKLNDLCSSADKQKKALHTSAPYPAEFHNIVETNAKGISLGLQFLSSPHPRFEAVKKFPSYLDKKETDHVPVIINKITYTHTRIQRKRPWISGGNNTIRSWSYDDALGLVYCAGKREVRKWKKITKQHVQDSIPNKRTQGAWHEQQKMAHWQALYRMVNSECYQAQEDMNHPLKGTWNTKRKRYQCTHTCAHTHARAQWSHCWAHSLGAVELCLTKTVRTLVLLDASWPCLSGVPWWKRLMVLHDSWGLGTFPLIDARGASWQETERDRWNNQHLLYENKAAHPLSKYSAAKWVAQILYRPEQKALRACLSASPMSCGLKGKYEKKKEASDDQS